MQRPLKVQFHNLEPSDFVTAYVEKKAAKLEQFYDRIVSCRVFIEGPGQHHNHGGVYRINIDLTVPGKELVVNRAPQDEASSQDLYAALDEAFDDMKRVLESWARKRRGEVKKHAGRIDTPRGGGF